MDALPISLEPRSFQGLLTGMIRRNFYGQEKDITLDYLAEELYTQSEIDSAQVANEILLYQKIILRAGHYSWDTEQFADFLAQRSLPDEHIKVARSIWLKESSKVRQAILNGVTWTNSLDRLSWRVDVRALSKTATTNTTSSSSRNAAEGEVPSSTGNVENSSADSTDVDVPVAFFEFVTNKPSFSMFSADTSAASTTVKFEMNQSDVGNMIAELRQIQKVFDSVV